MTKLNLFVSGMFRSGTTLLARMLNAHPSICLASDPFAPLFKCFRNQIAIEFIGPSFDQDSPLDDYYFQKDKKILFEQIHNTPLDIPLKDYTIEQIRNKVINHCRPYSPKIIPYMNELTGDTYAEILNSGICLVEKVYGKSVNSIIGIKEVWTNEFVQHFLDSFVNSKSILIVRDPRAVVASNYATSVNRYPILFLCRQWRKLAELSLYFSNRYEDVFLLKFEDLIVNPNMVSKRICKFLNIEFHQNLVEPRTFKDGKNQSWKQNSSYNDGKDGGKEFNKNVLEKWTEVLDTSMIKFIEAMCSDYMKKLGYKNKFDSSLPKHLNAVNQFNEVDNGIAEWIESYIDYDKKREYQYEIDRIKGLYNFSNRTMTSNYQLIDEDYF